MRVICDSCSAGFSKHNAEIKRTKHNFCNRQCRADFFSAMQKKKSLSNYFENESGCWVWAGNKNKDGYGFFKCEGVLYLAHRYFYKYHKGEIPENLCVCHKCDNPACLNPDHLFLGTHQENMDDMISKNRKWSKLTFDDVSYIRSCGESNLELSKKYGVSERTIRHAKCAKNWKPVKSKMEQD